MSMKLSPHQDKDTTRPNLQSCYLASFLHVSINSNKINCSLTSRNNCTRLNTPRPRAFEVLVSKSNFVSLIMELSPIVGAGDKTETTEQPVDRGAVSRANDFPAKIHAGTSRGIAWVKCRMVAFPRDYSKPRDVRPSCKCTGSVYPPGQLIPRLYMPWQKR